MHQSSPECVRKKPAAGYLPQFDTLRGVAVCIILFDHFGAKLPGFPLPDSYHLGVIAVRFFMVLSGYFITLSLLNRRGQIEDKSHNIKSILTAFYLNRFARIAPAYFIFILIGLALGLGEMRHQIGWLFTFTINFYIALQDYWPDAISHLWSLCVQEQFYLVWPILILIVPRNLTLPCIVLVALGGILFRAHCISSDATIMARWVLPASCLDSLAAGAIAAWLRKYTGIEPWFRNNVFCILLGFISILCLVFAFTLRSGDLHSYKSILAEPLEAFSMAFITLRVSYGLNGNLGKLLCFPILVGLGQISYGLYIYHILVSIICDTFIPAKFIWTVQIPEYRIFFLTTITILCAWLSWTKIEKPIMDYFRK